MKVKYRNKDISLPDFMIIGAAKSGTSSLFYYLNQHSQVYIPKVKEPWFFHLYRTKNTNIPRKNIISQFSDYLALYENSNKLLLGDASTIYLYDYKNVINNIKSIYGENYRSIKIIIILRNPTERAYSHYLNHVRDNTEDNTFEICFNKSKENKLDFYNEYFKYGLYFNQVKAYMESFDNVKIIFSENFAIHKKYTIESIFDFLNIDFEKIDLNINRNKTGYSRLNFLYQIIQSDKNFFKQIVKKIIPYKLGLKVKSSLIDLLLYKPKIHNDLKIDINNYYKEDIDNLKRILDEELLEWKK